MNVPRRLPMAQAAVATYSPAQPTNWQSAYKAVQRESDSCALFKLVEIAEAAIRTRREALLARSNHGVERRAIEDALKSLGRLKVKRLHFGNKTSIARTAAQLSARTKNSARW
jgi:hypothetical protein